MFEKEAEEYALKWGDKTDGTYASCKDGFKDGAEYGFNKANEWHYVKDGDLPKEDLQPITPGYYLNPSKHKFYKMRDFTQEEKELIVNTPINRMNCFDMSEFTDLYIDMEFGSIREQWLQTVKMLEALRIRCLKTKDEELFIEFVRMLPNSYKVVKL